MKIKIIKKKKEDIDKIRQITIAYSTAIKKNNLPVTCNLNNQTKLINFNGYEDLSQNQQQQIIQIIQAVTNLNREFDITDIQIIQEELELA